MPRLLNTEERSALASDFPAWQIQQQRDAMSRTFLFANFEAAFRFMQGCAVYAEQIDHHPEWLNVWNRVEVVLSTHSAGGLTLLDLQLAQWMDQTASAIGLQPPKL